MPAPKLILVAIKSPAMRGQAALRKAAQLAQATGARLELFHAITAPLYVDALALEGTTVPEVQKKWRLDALKALDRHAEPLRQQGLSVDIACDWDFPVYEAVVRRATRSRASLIVAERHATRHVLPWLLRFNDWELLRRSPVPVLLVKQARAWKRPVVLAAIDPSHVFAKPAGLDLDILKEGQALADALGGKLHAVHAYVDPMLVNDRLDSLAPEVTSKLKRQLATDARKAFSRELADRNIPAARRHLVAGHPVDVIPRIARKQRAAIAVMGAISRSGLKRLVIGNVAEQVLDALPCDVLVLKPADFKTRVSDHPRGVRLVATPAYG